MKKIIFLDIDGTLVVPGSNTPPESALSAIKVAQTNGHFVYLCTGRNMDMLAPLLSYGFDGVVALAGGYIMCGDEVIYTHPMTDDERDTALETLHSQGVFCTLEAADATYGDRSLSEFVENATETNSEIERWRAALANDLGIKAMEEYDGRPAYKVVFMCNDMSQLDKARDALEGTYKFCYQSISQYKCINGEIIHKDFDKGKAIARVCEHLGVSLDDTVGFGDSMNDYEMIETVATGVVMKNGVQDLKDIATMVCPAVDKDGLAAAFKELKLI